MPNGLHIINDMNFDQEIREMTDRQLIEFTARLSYSNSIRISSLEKRNNRTFGAVGGGAAMIGAAIAALIDYFVGR